VSPVAAPSRPSPARSGGRLKPSSGPGRTKGSAVALAALIAAVAALAAAPAPAQTPEPQASLPDLEDEVMCIVCGVPLGQAPDAPQAERERAFIRELIAEGRTKDEIKDALVAEFGENVLATPDTEGFDLAAWLVPGLAILVAAVAIGFGVRRWRRETPRDGPGPDGSAGSPEDPRESERLDADLARYDL
jgi:cytochrome c-type biogenesis protein CcmH